MAMGMIEMGNLFFSPYNIKHLRLRVTENIISNKN